VPPAQHHVYVKDARLFLRTTPNQYDVIWVDAFARHLVPFHLTTKEFFAEVRAHLKPDGVLAVNLAASGSGSDRQRSQSVVATMRTSFPAIESFAVKGSKGADNLIFFAGAPTVSMRPQEFQARINRLIDARRMPAETAALLVTRRESAWSDAVVLTDDYAPFDLLMAGGMGGRQ
ncbi:MAG: spermidine synthase, partial [Nitrospiraceae bacterium]